MKKLLTIAALVGATSLSFGQGYVSFLNTTGSRFSTNAAGTAPGTGFVTATARPIGTYYFALFAAPSTKNTISTSVDPTLNGWTYVAIATNTPQAGRLDGNNSDNANSVNVPGFAASTTADFAIAGWSSNIGTSWAEAQAWWANGSYAGATVNPGSFGINPTVANDIGLVVIASPYNGVFGNNVAGLMFGWGLSYSPVPEPSTFALVGLGAAAMLIFRRRKA